MAGKMKPIEKIKVCIRKNRNFVLQGGAGSGKTETLKDVIAFVSTEFPAAKICCITHTNLAADEIIGRVGEFNGSISTIHSFLNNFIKNYKINIHRVIHNLFEAPIVVRSSQGSGESDKDYKKREHESYKKIFEKYASSLASIQNQMAGKAIGKREYDKDPEKFNVELNSKIEALNKVIVKEIGEREPDSIKYNETRFNNFRDLSYGHDGLLKISYHLFKDFPVLRKVLVDRYNFIFIDEYQDTSELVINSFFREAPKNRSVTLGLFGDSMQSIYEDGIGSVQGFIDEGLLEKIEKEDNFRCSIPVITFINGLRNDGLTQKPAFKLKENGEIETEADRQGSVRFFYSIYQDKPNAFSKEEDKRKYTKTLDKLIEHASGSNSNFKVLMLTNKSIASKVGFSNLFDTFSRRYVEPKDKIDDILTKLQVFQLLELCGHYENGRFNEILSYLKSIGFSIKKVQDKIDLKNKFDSIWESDRSISETLELAFSLNLIKKSDSYIGFIKRRNEFLESLKTDKDYKQFKQLYSDGRNTFKKMSEASTEIDEDTFDEKKKEVLQEEFYTSLFSEKMKFKEALSYFRYSKEETEYITMHNTKGSSIDNVLVVLDEYFWNQYKFSELYYSGTNESLREKTQKLAYVACSRTRKNLYCVRLVSDQDEEKEFKKFFNNASKIEI